MQPASFMSTSCGEMSYGEGNLPRATEPIHSWGPTGTAHGLGKSGGGELGTVTPLQPGHQALAPESSDSNILASTFFRPMNVEC